MKSADLPDPTKIQVIGTLRVVLRFGQSQVEHLLLRFVAVGKFVMPEQLGAVRVRPVSANRGDRPAVTVLAISVYLAHPDVRIPLSLAGYLVRMRPRYIAPHEAAGNPGGH